MLPWMVFGPPIRMNGSGAIGVAAASATTVAAATVVRERAGAGEAVSATDSGTARLSVDDPEDAVAARVRR